MLSGAGGDTFWYQQAFLDSAASDMCFGYGDQSAAIHVTVDVSDFLIMPSNGMPTMSPPKRIRNVSHIVSQMTSAWQTQSERQSC
jgi:hypothetical protein